MNLRIKSFVLATAACFMSFTVVMSAAHAKDVVKDQSHDPGVIARTADPIAKALGDLHSHTDKQTLKSITMDNPITAREREIRALNETKTSRNLLELLEEAYDFYRLAFALRFSLAIA